VNAPESKEEWGINDRWPKLAADQLDIYYLTANANFLLNSPSLFFVVASGGKEKLLA